MRLTRAHAGGGEVYTDISYHDMALDPALRRAYFTELVEVLSHPQEGQGVVFGTDACMTSHTWSESDYVKPFRRYLDEKLQRKLLATNPLSFLFGPSGEIPPRCVKALQREDGSLPERPVWVRQENGRYCVIPVQ